jgi:hypothetical protein
MILKIIRLNEGTGIYLPLLEVNVMVGACIYGLLPSIWRGGSCIHYNSSLHLISIRQEALIEGRSNIPETKGTEMSSSHGIIRRSI